MGVAVNQAPSGRSTVWVSSEASVLKKESRDRGESSELERLPEESQRVSPLRLGGMETRNVCMQRRREAQGQGENGVMLTCFFFISLLTSLRASGPLVSAWDYTH